MSRRHIAELSVKDLALVSDLRLELGPGLIVLTGETGAGKSMLVDALVAVAGGRVAAGMVRDGADRARVEAVFADGDADDLVLSREIGSRGRARIDDRTIPVSTLAERGSELVAVHTQGEQTRLARPATQRDLLDAFGAHEGLRVATRGSHAKIRALAGERALLGGDPRERARRIALLTHEVDEIAGARLAPEEEQRLHEALTIARSAEQLRAAAHAARELLAGERSAADRLSLAHRELATAAGTDATLAPLADRIAAAAEEAHDVAGELRRYAESIDADAAHLAALESRDELLFDLRRKYGTTVAEVLVYEERARAELDTLSSHEERLAKIDTEESAARLALKSAAAVLHDARSAAAARLADAVLAELAGLGLPRCGFSVELTPQDPDATGGDLVRFLIAPNPGEPPAPLGEIASGGELSRIMLAIEVVLAAHDNTPVLVFDEVDSGVGGRLGEVLGRKLWTLARDHQVLCVSHLPQVAAYADTHIRVGKEVRKGRTHVLAERLAPAQVLEELGAMLGAGGRPRELVRSAADWKKTETG